MIKPRIILATSACLTAISALPAQAQSDPFQVKPVSLFELKGVRGGYQLHRGGVQSLVRDQLEAFDRQTGQIAAVTFDNWSFDVGLPLIAANLRQ